jgi:hypothetical protein
MPLKGRGGFAGAAALPGGWSDNDFTSDTHDERHS